MIMFLGLPSSSLLTDFTRAYDIYLHERSQFWPGTDMENIGQTEMIEVQLHTEIWGSFTVSLIKKLNKVSDPCEEAEDYSFTECLMEFVVRSTGCYLDWGQTFSSANYPVCTTLQQIISMEKLLHRISKLSWTKLTKITRCYGKCQYKKFTFTQVNVRETGKTMLEFLSYRPVRRGSTGKFLRPRRSSSLQRRPGLDWRRRWSSLDLMTLLMGSEGRWACSWAGPYCILCWKVIRTLSISSDLSKCLYVQTVFTGRLKEHSRNSATF